MKTATHHHPRIDGQLNIFQAAYDAAIEDGKSEVEAQELALDALVDHQTHMIDNWRAT